MIMGQNYILTHDHGYAGPRLIGLNSRTYRFFDLIKVENKYSGQYFFIVGKLDAVFHAE